MSSDIVKKWNPWNNTANQFLVIAGPCSVENEEQMTLSAKSVQESGAALLRGGVFKLRTKPESFQGLGSNAFPIVQLAKQKTNMGFVTEVTDPRQIGDLLDITDVFKVGSRNMFNYDLLKELGKVDRPVILKRAFSGLIKEWILAADYIRKSGNDKVILCERGIRSFETATRNTLDLNAVAYIKHNHKDLPIIVDPSHGTGIKELVEPMALAAIAAGADGLLIEVHPNPSEALSDGFQALTPNDFDDLMKKCKQLLPLFNKTLVTLT